MYTRTAISPSTAAFSPALDRLRRALREADALLIGAGAGMSASAGLTYSGPRFEENFADFIARYGYRDMYTAGFYPYPTREEYWAYWSRHILINRYDQTPGAPYRDLRRLTQGQDFFVLTTNVDHQFQLAGIDKNRLFYTQGDYGLWQCRVPCHQRTYDNEAQVRRMVEEQRNRRIPAELVPRCPVCGEPVTMNLRCDGTFVQDEGWNAACERYTSFLRRHRSGRLVLLELGVGGNTPGIIKYPFWRMAADNAEALYVCINQGEAFCPPELAERSLCFNADIGAVLRVLLN